VRRFRLLSKINRFFHHFFFYLVNWVKSFKVSCTSSLFNIFL
jgi:hypothetical protein